MLRPLMAGHARKAQQLLNTQAFDLVLCDWNMPEMNGMELLNVLRGQGDTTPFGFVTSEGSAQMRERAEAAGALFLIAKPFTPETFAEVLEPVLG